MGWTQQIPTSIPWILFSSTFVKDHIYIRFMFIMCNGPSGPIQCKVHLPKRLNPIPGSIYIYPSSIHCKFVIHIVIYERCSCQEIYLVVIGLQAEPRNLSILLILSCFHSCFYFTFNFNNIFSKSYIYECYLPKMIIDMMHSKKFCMQNTILRFDKLYQYIIL